MPGVPSGRGCDGCRLQKKKCDQAKPSCSRCTRLRIPCVGSGERRYKFKEEQGFRNGLDTKPAAKRRGDNVASDLIKAVPHTPSNGLTIMVNAFTEMIKPSTDLRYNLAWSFGAFLVHVPQRLGTNEALDASAVALIDAHSNFCSRRGVTVDSLLKYSRALSKLRHYLNDPIKARTSETLCAVMLLLICQRFIGMAEPGWSGHCEGAVQILKARRYFDRQDKFESQLLLSLRGPVVFEGLLNSRIQLNPSEWTTLVENHFDEDNYGSKIMRCLSRAPDFIRQGKSVRRSKSEDPKLLGEMNSNYQTLKAVVEELQTQLVTVESHMTKESRMLAPVVQAHFYFQHLYGLALLTGMVFGCLVRALDIENTEVASEVELYAKELLALAESALRYAPLGANYVPLLLIAAWVGTNDHVVKSRALTALLEFREKYESGQRTVQLDVELERLSRHFRLLDLDPYLDAY